MSLKVDDLKAKLTGGGARPNLFEVILPEAGLDQSGSILCKAASLPSSIISPIVMPWRGRQLQLAGDRTFEPWTLTIINDTDFSIRTAFESWMNDINAHVAGTGTADPGAYMKDAIVNQLDRNDNVVRSYDFKGIWPSNISQIDLAYDSENVVEEFTVELQVTYWTAQGSTDG
jgi:hypothetical protein